MSLDPPASQPPVSLLMPVSESSPLGRPDPPTPGATRGDLAAPDGLPGRMSAEGKQGAEQERRTREDVDRQRK